MLTFSEISSNWESISSPLAHYPINADDIQSYIEENINPTSFNSHAVTAIDVRTRKYLYVDDRIEQVTGYTKEEYLKYGPKYLFSKIPLSHKYGVFKSTFHQNKFISNLTPEKTRDIILFREYNLYDRKGKPQRILHQILNYIFDPDQKVKAIISLQTNIDHLSTATKFKYYIYSKTKNKIIYPKTKNQTLDTFTPREKEIILLISEGLTSSQIAEKLFLSLHTIKTHRKNILKKSNASSFLELLNSLNS